MMISRTFVSDALTILLDSEHLNSPPLLEYGRFPAAATERERIRNQVWRYSYAHDRLRRFRIRLSEWTSRALCACVQSIVSAAALTESSQASETLQCALCLNLEVQMVDCVVCQYWSERLEETRARGKNALKEETRLISALRRHQCGACACRFPDLLRDLVKQELELPDIAPFFCGPGRAPMLADNLPQEFGALPIYQWQ